MTEALQLPPKLPVIVDLSIEDKHCSVALGEHGLIGASRNIDDRQPRVSETDLPGWPRPETDPIRAAMTQRQMRITCHRGHRTCGSGDPAHYEPPPIELCERTPM